MLPLKNIEKSSLKIFQRILLSENFILYLTILFFLILIPIIPQIVNQRNLLNVMSNIWPFFILALGQMYVLLTGGIDLSQTSIMALVSVFLGMLISENFDPIVFSTNPFWDIFIFQNGGLLSNGALNIIFAILLVLAVGISFGYFNGLAVAKFNMPPFMVTLVSMITLSGLAIFITQSENVTNLPNTFVDIGSYEFGIFSIPLLLALLFGILSLFVIKKTVWGRWLYAIGKNIRASLVSGVPTNKVIIFAYMVSGFSSALASLIYTARLAGGRPTLGQNQLLDIIGAVVIGGISLFGGRGKVSWVLFGVLFFVLLSNALNMLNISYYTVSIIKGGIILFAAWLDITRVKILKAKM